MNIRQGVHGKRMYRIETILYLSHEKQEARNEKQNQLP